MVRLKRDCRAQLLKPGSIVEHEEIKRSLFFAILCCMINEGCERNAPALARDPEMCVLLNQLSETEAYEASHGESVPPIL